MSELTRCNYCSWRDMVRRAAERGVEVILEPDEYGWLAARYSDSDEPNSRFLALTGKCVC